MYSLYLHTVSPVGQRRRRLEQDRRPRGHSGSESDDGAEAAAPTSKQGPRGALSNPNTGTDGKRAQDSASASAPASASASERAERAERVAWKEETEAAAASSSNAQQRLEEFSKLREDLLRSKRAVKVLTGEEAAQVGDCSAAGHQ